MNRLLVLALGALAVTGCRDAIGPAPQAPPTDIAPSPSLAAPGGAPEQRPGHYIVILHGDVSSVAQAEGRLMSGRAGDVEHTYRHVLRGFAAQLSPSQAAALARDPAVARVVPDVIVHAQASESNAWWGIDRVDQRNLPRDGFYTYTETGAGVNVYILDTGIRYTHTEFGGRAKFGYDAFGGDGSDCDGHGTHVAATVGGTTYGIAKQVTLYSVRVLDCTGSGPLSGIIAGIDWVTAHHQSPAVANMSLGSQAVALLDTAVMNSVQSGVTYTVAAGNYDADACGYSPARVGTAITVGATDSTDTRWQYSDYGSCVSLFAPGVYIKSADYYSDVATAIMTGTSMAAPHVAGVAALYLQAHPSASPAQVKQALLANATTGHVINPAGTANLLAYSGFLLSSGTTPPSSTAPTAVITSSCSGTTCTFDGSSSTVPNGAKAYSWYFGDGTAAGAESVTHTYGSAGTYTVTFVVTDSLGNKSTATKSVTVGSGSSTSPGTSTFTAVITSSCSGTSCTFDGSSSTVPNGAKAYSWYFGDGTAAGAESVTHTYASAGTYTVTFVITDTQGNKSTATKSVTVGSGSTTPPPSTTFTAVITSSCSGTTCTFDGSSSTVPNGAKAYSWYFGDGTAAGAESVTHTYASAGTYTVTFVITDTQGNKSTATKTITVGSTAPPPSTTFTAVISASCSGSTCLFDGSGSTVPNGAKAYSWYFGDGKAAGAETVSHTYSTSGTYTVTFVITDTLGNKAKATRSVTIP